VLIRIIVLLLAFAAPLAHAQLVIKITRGGQRATPIAVVPFGNQGAIAAPLDIAAVVAADLQRSGRFEPLGRDAMIERPTRGTEVDYQDWRLLGAEIVVVGEVTPRGGDNWELRFEALDVFGAKRVVGEVIPSTGAQLRAAAHRISDRIYEAFTGVRGAFSTRIAYVGLERQGPNERYRLWIADADGENAQVIAESEEPILSPSWSPEGHRLAYAGYENHASAVYVQDLASGARKRVSFRAGVNSAPAWSPDGQKLAVALSEGDGNVELYILNLATEELQRLTRNPAIDTEPTWSRDGRNIYFTSDRSGGPQIYRLDVYGGDPQRLTFEGGYNARPRLSPDETRLALVHGEGARYRIAVLDLKTRSLQVLTDGRLDESPSFAPNGSMIIYATLDGGEGVLAAVAVDGSVQQQLSSSGGAVREPAWSPFPPQR
jgi:TolB protein